MAVNSTQTLTTSGQCSWILSEVELHQRSAVHKEHSNVDAKTDKMVSKPWAAHTTPSQLQDTGSLPGSQLSMHLEMHGNIPNGPHTAIWCGRESRHTRLLPHSKQFPGWSSTRAHIISEGFGFHFIHFSSFILFLFPNFTFLFHLFKQRLTNLNIRRYGFPFLTANQLGPNGPKHWTVEMRGNVRESSAPVGAPGRVM